MAAMEGRSRARSKSPAKHEGSAPKRTKHWRTTFLAVLAETSNVTQSAKASGASVSQVYELRRKDAGFRAQWHTALCDGYDFLEMDVLRRLREGDFITAEGGKFDFACALRILLAHRDTVGAERARQNDDDEEAVYASITAKIEVLKKAWQNAPPAVPATDGEPGRAG